MLLKQRKPLIKSNWYIEKLFPIQKKILSKLKPILEKTLSLPLHEEEVYETVEELYEELVAIKNILVNKECVL
jgi:arsenite-transporting ATPase